MNAEIDVYKPITRAPVYGVFRWWPEPGEAWIHSFDVGIAKQLIPSDRVFRRVDSGSDFQILTYGSISLRVRSCLWNPVRFEGFQIGDCVEVKSDYGKRQPLLGRIREMRWNEELKRIEYFLSQGAQALKRPYAAAELSPIDNITHRRRLERPSVVLDMPVDSGSRPTFLR